jgi:hypothetical protein
MADNTTPAPSGWRVTGQTPAKQPTTAGTFENGINVTFITGKGVVGTIFVPETVYNPDNVRTLIAQKVAVLDAVSDLNG